MLVQSVVHQYDKMCSKLYTFCLVFIMVADCQEGPRKIALFTKKLKFFHIFSTIDTNCVCNCMDGLVHERDNVKCVV